MPFLAILCALAAFVAPEFVLAQAQPSLNYGNIDPCPIRQILGVGCYANPDANPYILNLLVGPRGIKTMFATFVLAMFILYGIKLLVLARDETVMTEIKTAYAHALFGAVLVGGAFLLSDTFTAPEGLIVNPAFFNPVVLNVVIFIKGMLVTIVIMNLFRQGVRLIYAQNPDENANAKKALLRGMIGSAIIMLANSLVVAFFGINVGIASIEILGIARFLATVFGGMAVIGLVVAGIMLVMALEDALKERAKKLIVICLVTLLIVIGSYGLVTVFILPG